MFGLHGRKKQGYKDHKKSKCSQFSRGISISEKIVLHLLFIESEKQRGRRYAFTARMSVPALTEPVTSAVTALYSSVLQTIIGVVSL